jgi:membrane protein YdbS with pleckstrin-like domain
VELLSALTTTQGRHFQEIGLLVAGVGAVVLIVAAALGLQQYSVRAERGTMIAAGVLLVVGIFLQVFGVHRGF